MFGICENLNSARHTNRIFNKTFFSFKSNMPMYEDYYSDASMSSDTDTDDEDDRVELYDPRDREYWAIEAVMDVRKPPPAIEYLCQLCSFELRECVVLPVRRDIESVVDSKSANSWHRFWRREPQRSTARFSHDDWDAIGEFAMQICECCLANPTREQIQSCIIRMLSLGRFVRPQYAVALPRARRR